MVAASGAGLRRAVVDVGSGPDHERTDIRATNGAAPIARASLARGTVNAPSSGEGL